MYLNIGQHIFLVFFAVFYGTLLIQLSGLHAFPWGLWHEKPRPEFRLLWRLFVSIGCFYVLPAFIFGLAFSALSGYPEGPLMDQRVPLVVLSALTAFAPYRLYVMLMIMLRNTPLSFYSREGFEEIITQRHIRPSPTCHTFAFLLFASLLVLDFWIGGAIG
ncbi:MAG: hypothetical protein BMS9Abin05_2433 [Rhodothermia bacterium]|nr:MAG: hypothetical protein BMS9Abin05_2433 [Rhodothermia bacterium]